MAFEDTPEDREESCPCECGGSITKDKNQDDLWQCDKCDWSSLKGNEVK